MITEINVLSHLKEKHLTISFAESMTGGLLAYKLVIHQGASNHLKGSIITYTNEMKHRMLGIELTDIERFGVVSKEVAVLMAKKVKQLTTSNIGVSVTGNADYKYQENGKLSFYYAIITDSETYHFHAFLENENRVDNIQTAASMIYQTLDKILSK